MDLSSFRKSTDDEEETWAGWLRGDEQEPESPQLKPRKEPLLDLTRPGVEEPPQLTDSLKKPRGKKKSSGQDPAISIEIHMPHIRVPKPHIPWKRLRPWLITGGVIIVLLVGGGWIQTKLSQNKPAPQKTPTVVAAELGYKPLSPPARINVPASQQKPVYNKEKKIYIFHDEYLEAIVDVTQQAVPPELFKSTAKQKELENSVGTTDSFTTTLGTVHVMTSKETGGQRLFLFNDKMLMFLQSTKILSNADWAEYIQTLE